MHWRLFDNLHHLLLIFIFISISTISLIFDPWIPNLLICCILVTHQQSTLTLTHNLLILFLRRHRRHYNLIGHSRTLKKAFLLFSPWWFKICLSDSNISGWSLSTAYFRHPWRGYTLCRRIRKGRWRCNSIILFKPKINFSLRYIRPMAAIISNPNNISGIYLCLQGVLRYWLRFKLLLFIVIWLPISIDFIDIVIFTSLIILTQLMRFRLSFPFVSATIFWNYSYLISAFLLIWL